MKKNAKRKIKIAIVLCLLIVFSAILFLSFQRNVKPVVYTYCDALISSLGVECINSSAADVVALYEYSDFIRIEKTGDKIDYLTADAPTVNGFTRSLALRCENALNALGIQKIKVPMGAFTGSVLMSNRGPKVSVDITFFSSVKCDFLTIFENVGINQTRHAIYAKIDVWFNTVLPISEHELRLTNNILVAENVIVGEIPEVFVNGENGLEYLDLIP